MLKEIRIMSLILAYLVLVLTLTINASADTLPITLTTLTPTSGQAGISNITIHSTGFPKGMILPESMTVQLTPSGGGTPITSKAFQLSRFDRDRQNVSFIIPKSISVASPTQYHVSLSGTAPNKEQYASTNALTLTVNPPSIVTLNTISDAAGQTIQVDITGTYTNFAKRITAANFGPGISVGKGSPGGWGHLIVNSLNSATAIVKIDSETTTGPRTIKVRTGAQEETATFIVNASSTEPQQITDIDTALIRELDDSTSTVLYTITDLGTFGGSESYAEDINASGHVTGYSDTLSSQYAFIYSSGIMADLGPLGGYCSNGNAINNFDQVTGTIFFSTFWHAFFYSGGVVTDLGTLGGKSSDAAGINNFGQVTGESLNFNGTARAFLYSGGMMTDLGTLGGNESCGYEINDSGQVTGSASTIAGDIHPFLYSGGVMTDLGTLGGSYSSGYSINNSGQVTGLSNSHAFLYSGGVMTDLGTLGGSYSAGWCINDSGQVTGNSTTSNGSYHAFLYSNGVMTDLNTFLPAGSGWTLYSATINNSGQIAGTGFSPFGYLHAFLLTSNVPDLTITKTHTGNFRQGQNGGIYNIRVLNKGNAPTNGTVTVTDVLPTGLTATYMKGYGWNCDVTTLTCTQSSSLAAGRSYFPITLIGKVAADAPASVTNTATVSGGGETNILNNTASDITTITPVAPDLTITNKHLGIFKKGLPVAYYIIRVTNSGNSPTSGTVSVTDTIPSGLTAKGIWGAGWNCNPVTLTCIRSNTLRAHATYPPIILKVSVDSNAPASVTNTATVSGGGERNTNNNTANDTVTIK